MHSLSVLLSALGTTRTTQIDLVLAWWPSFTQVCASCLLIVATIQRQHLFCSRASATIQGWRLFEEIFELYPPLQKGTYVYLFPPQFCARCLHCSLFLLQAAMCCCGQRWSSTGRVVSRITRCWYLERRWAGTAHVTLPPLSQWVVVTTQHPSHHHRTVRRSSDYV